MHIINGFDQSVVGDRKDSIAVPYSSDANESALAYIRTMYYHIHSPAKCYPSAADPVTLTSTANAWGAHGTPTEIIPADIITTSFDLHWVQVSDISNNDFFEIKLYKGSAGSEVEICQISFFKNAGVSQEGNMPVQVPQIQANTRVSASLINKSASAYTCKVKVYYHEYGA